MPSKTEHPSRPAEVTEHSRGPGRGGGGGEEGVRVGVGTLFQLALSHCPVCVRASCFSLWAMGIWGGGWSLLFSASSPAPRTAPGAQRELRPHLLREDRSSLDTGLLPETVLAGKMTVWVAMGTRGITAALLWSGPLLPP